MQRFMNTFLIVTFLSLVIPWAGCGGVGTSVPLSESTSAPEWYVNIPSDPDHFYAVATGQSRDEQMAIDTAKHSARVEIANRSKTRIEQFLEEADVESIFAKGTGSLKLSGCRVLEEEVKQEDSTYRAYVMIEMPVAEADAALVAEVRQNTDLHNRLKTSHAFKELEEKVEKYEQIKRESTQYLYGTGIGRDSKLEIALEMARHNARIDIARQLEIRIKWTDTVTSGSSEETTQGALVGCEMVKQEVKQDGSDYRAYVQMRMPAPASKELDK